MDKFYVHERAVCDSKTIGEGTRVWGFSHVMAGAQIGKNCNIGEHVFIENKAVIGDGCTIKNGVAVWDLVTLENDVFIGPYVVFTNDMKPRAFLKRTCETFLPTIVRRGATIGANSTIVCGVTIGEYSMVGSGSVVTKNVLPHTLSVGNPCRPLCRICFCAERLDDRDFCKVCQLPLNENSREKTIERFAKL